MRIAILTLLLLCAACSAQTISGEADPHPLPASPLPFSPEVRDAWQAAIIKCDKCVRGLPPSWELQAASPIFFFCDLSHCFPEGDPIVQPAPRPKDHFWRSHPTRTVLIGFGIGGGIGLMIEKFTEHNCSNTYDGKPYYGTPPCPKDTTPGARRRAVRLSFRF